MSALTVPVASAKNQLRDVDKFTSLMRRLVAVPHSENEAQLDAEKAEMRNAKPSVSRAPAAPSKKRPSQADSALSTVNVAYVSLGSAI